MTDQLKISMLASNAASGLARTLVAARIRKWNYLCILDDALLVTAELVANATEAAPRQQVKLHLLNEAPGVLIGVWDPSDKAPRAKPALDLTLETLDLSEKSWENNGGWGLPIVQALATECGYTPEPTGGKWVWARLKPSTP